MELLELRLFKVSRAVTFLIFYSLRRKMSHKFSNKKTSFARVVGLSTLISVSKPWLQLICFCSSTQQKIWQDVDVLRVGANTQLKNVDVLSWNLIRPSANLLSSWKGQEWRSRRRRQRQTMPWIIRNQQIRWKFSSSYRRLRSYDEARLYLEEFLKEKFSFFFYEAHCLADGGKQKLR